MKLPPSIFNDVIGPVMRGPSSSHCAASVRIGRLARDLMDGRFHRVLIEFHPAGSLASTHDSQGSDMGLFAGLLGWQATDPRLPHSPRAIAQAGIRIDIRVTDYPADHPNTYRLTLFDDQRQHQMVAVSTGGGMIQVTAIDGIDLSIAGDYYETLLFCRDHGQALRHALLDRFPADHVLLASGPDQAIVQVKAQRFVDQDLLEQLTGRFPVHAVRKLAPVLPVLSRRDLSVPFLSCRQMLQLPGAADRSLDELAIDYETRRSGLDREQVVAMMTDIITLLRRSLAQGLAGTHYDDRILGFQSGGYQQAMQDHRLLDCGLADRAVLYVSAFMEVKSAMGLILAAPTAGACGTLPGTLLAAADALGLSDPQAARAMLAAGLVGLFIAAGSTFAAEVGGCQAETGSGSAMAAAALVHMAGGNTPQALGAASMALQNTLGMICDPIANRVEAPCLGKNVLGAVNALACANMALAGFDPLIPLDEVIATHYAVGKTIPAPLRCTAQGGLSVTPTSRAIQQRLESLKKKPPTDSD